MIINVTLPAHMHTVITLRRTGSTRVFLAADNLLILHRFQQDKLTVEGEHEALALLVEEEDGVCVLLRLWECRGETVDTQLIWHSPQTQNLSTCEAEV